MFHKVIFSFGKVDKDTDVGKSQCDTLTVLNYLSHHNNNERRTVASVDQ